MTLKNYIIGSIEDSFNTGIYKIYHERDKNYFYIGSALKVKSRSAGGFYNRWYKHFNSLENKNHSNVKIQRYFDKYGIEGLKFEIVEFCKPEVGLEREQYYLDFFNCVDQGLNCSYNTIYFAKGRILSATHREILSKLNKNKIVSEQTRKRISDSKKGIFMSQERKLIHRELSPNKIITFLYNLEGELLQTFSSGAECDLFFNKRKGRSSFYVITKRIMYRKYIVSYCLLELSFFENLKKPTINGGYNTSRGGNAISLYTKNNVFISDFRTQMECAAYINCGINTITAYLKGRQKVIQKKYIVKLINKTTSC